VSRRITGYDVGVRRTRRQTIARSIRMSQTPEEPIPGQDPSEESDLESAEQQYDEVYTGEVDPDIDAARELSEEREEDALVTDDLLPEEEMTEYEPPEAPSTPTALAETELDEADGETIDDRLAQEEPDEQP